MRLSHAASFNELRVSDSGTGKRPSLTKTSLSGPSIQIIVGGADPVSFTVHENLICSRGELFKRLIETDRKISNSRTIRLRHLGHHYFEVYLHWLYRGIFTKVPERTRPGADSYYLYFARAYVLGLKVEDDDFQDAVLDAFVDLSNSPIDGLLWLPGADVILYIYDTTTKNDKARALIVDMLETRAERDWLENTVDVNYISKEFLYDFSIALSKRKANKQPETDDPCKYHRHLPDATLCYRNNKPLSMVQAVADAVMAEPSVDGEDGDDAVSVSEAGDEGVADSVSGAETELGSEPGEAHSNSAEESDVEYDEIMDETEPEDCDASEETETGEEDERIAEIELETHKSIYHVDF